MEKADCSFYHLEIHINYTNWSSLNTYALLPRGIVLAYFTNRATGDSVTVKLNESTPRRFMACVFLAKKNHNVTGVDEWAHVTCNIIDKHNGLAAREEGFVF